MSGFFVVFGKSHVVFAPRWYGACPKYVLNWPLIADFGAKLLNRSMLPREEVGQGGGVRAVLDVDEYVGPTLLPSADAAHQSPRFFHTTVSDAAPTPDWYTYGPVPTSFFGSLMFPVVISVFE